MAHTLRKFERETVTMTLIVEGGRPPKKHAGVRKE
jgi:hypothetical protein